MLSHTLVEPDTVVVVLVHTHVADLTVFAASRLHELAGFALLVAHENQLVIWMLLYKGVYVFRGHD